MSLWESFHPPFLFISPKFFACWCLSHGCGHVMVMLKVFASCVPVVFTMKESIALTHRFIFTIAQASSRQSKINHKCRSCHLHCRLFMLNMCISMFWVISSSSHVSVCLHDHLCIFRSFTHLVILLKLWRPNYHLIVRPSPRHKKLPRTT